MYIYITYIYINIYISVIILYSLCILIKLKKFGTLKNLGKRYPTIAILNVVLSLKVIYYTEFY